MSLQSSEWFSRKGIECSRVVACEDFFPRHLHDEYVISANLSGTEAIWMDGKTAEVCGGHITVYNPAAVQSSRFGQQAVEFVSVHLPQSTLQSLVNQQNLRSSAEAPALREGVLQNPALFNAICRYASTARDEDADAQEQEFLLLCGALLEDEVTADRHGEQAVARAKDYLRENLIEKPQLDQLAQICGLSKYHLVRRFSQLMGLPPLQYHMQLRLHRARDLLRSGIHPLDTAIALGFYDQSHFINAFRKVMGITPHHYARQVCSARNKFSVA
ncbi:AraC family transcriptional regulator [Rouxiella badensis]|uniref:AraC family transcriptional regulator n=1 Tax=Rouxiella badensis TaxID=1646377 RepID=UPI001B5FC245|nr:AraC family transcriptional regulator [Rouxiella badensis]MCC3746510.1 AraC family transcriptional regulator [Rouxiella badensis]